MLSRWRRTARPNARASRAERGRRSRVLGRRGERVARRALRRAGYRILARNLRTPYGEIDIVALEREVLVVVEVKTTARADPAPASRRVPPRQAHRLRRASAWLARRGSASRRVRHDLVLVQLRAGDRAVTIRRGGF